jgi:urease accessory protein
MLSLLLALQQADAGFPNGGFAFSNGMEGLAAIGAPLDGPGLVGVLTAVLRHRWASCDRIALAHAWRAEGDLTRLAAIDQALEAATIPESLRRGSRRNGGALLAAHLRLGTTGAAGLRQAVEDGTLLGHLPVLQGSLWRRIGLEEALALYVSGYTTVSGLVSAAVRLGCLGAIAAQAALRDVLPLIETLAKARIVDDDRLAGALPWLDVACTRQQAAPLRLFAN